MARPLVLYAHVPALFHVAGRHVARPGKYLAAADIYWPRTRARATKKDLPAAGTRRRSLCAPAGRRELDRGENPICLRLPW